MIRITAIFLFCFFAVCASCEDVIVVQIRCNDIPTKDGPASGWGQGMVYGRGVLTAAHVVCEGKSTEVLIGDEENPERRMIVPMVLKWADKAYDLAYLEPVYQRLTLSGLKCKHGIVGNHPPRGGIGPQTIRPWSTDFQLRSSNTIKILSLENELHGMDGLSGAPVMYHGKNQGILIRQLQDKDTGELYAEIAPMWVVEHFHEEWKRGKK